MYVKKPIYMIIAIIELSSNPKPEMRTHVYGHTILKTILVPSLSVPVINTERKDYTGVIIIAQ